MTELLFVVCLAAMPAQCQQRGLLYTDITQFQCLLGAQPELAKWVAAHPNQQIKSWSCRAVSFTERDA